MEPEEYKDLTTGPDVVRRTVVEATIRRLADHRDLVKRLSLLLRKPPVTKPPRHDAGTHTDFLTVDLTIHELEQLVDALADNEARLALDDTADSELSYTSTLLDTWNAVLLFRKAAV